jgi:hypothetical protein
VNIPQTILNFPVPHVGNAKSPGYAGRFEYGKEGIGMEAYD